MIFYLMSQSQLYQNKNKISLECSVILIKFGVVQLDFILYITRYPRMWLDFEIFSEHILVKLNLKLSESHFSSFLYL